MPARISRFSLPLAHLAIVRSQPSELPAWAIEHLWDFKYPYPGKESGRFILLHRDRPRPDWTEEFYFCIDDRAIEVETMEQLAGLVKEHLGFEMYSSLMTLPGNG